MEEHNVGSPTARKNKETDVGSPTARKNKEDTKRRSRYARPKTPEPLALTERDRRILARVWQDRMLYTSQISRIFFSSKAAASVRLRRLWENGYLDRCFIPTLIFHGCAEALYFLDKKGVDVVSTNLEVERMKVLQGLRYLNWKIGSKSFLLTLDHNLAIAEFRIAFCEASDDHPDIRYIQWVPERMCQEEYKTWKLMEGKVKGKFRPDGYGQYAHRDRQFSFFVEVDLATMSNKAFEDKVQRYLDYSKSGGCEDRYGTKLFRVLVATVGSQRLANLKRATEKCTDSIFWFTTLDQVCRERFFGKVWQRAGKTGLHSLLDR
jgi:hypothetical protein